MKKLLIQLDTDSCPSVFDTIVAYDGGADQVIRHADCTPENVASIVEGAVFTRSPKEKKFTALFVGGSDIVAGDALFKAVCNCFFADFRVSAMLDSNGSNTTAAAGVAKLINSVPIAGKKAVILAGTGPVGQRAAVFMAQEGAKVSITSRRIVNAEQACKNIQEKFNIEVTPIEAADNDARGAAIADAQVVFSTGSGGVELLELHHWRDNANVEILVDANAMPPLGIGGTEMFDRAENRHNKIVWGAIGFGAFKLAVHRACIGKLFTSSDQIFDAETIFALAKKMV